MIEVYYICPWIDIITIQAYWGIQVHIRLPVPTAQGNHQHSCTLLCDRANLNKKFNLFYLYLKSKTYLALHVTKDKKTQIYGSVLLCFLKQGGCA